MPIMPSKSKEIFENPGRNKGCSSSLQFGTVCMHASKQATSLLDWRGFGLGVRGLESSPSSPTALLFGPGCLSSPGCSWVCHQFNEKVGWSKRSSRPLLALSCIHLANIYRGPTMYVALFQAFEIFREESKDPCATEASLLEGWDNHKQ